MRRFLATFAMLSLSACAIVTVHTDGASPRLSAWLGGVRVEAAPRTALTVSPKTLGLFAACGLYGVGYTSARCITIPADTCGLAIIQNPPQSSLPHWSWLFDQTQAVCLKGTTP